MRESQVVLEWKREAELSRSRNYVLRALRRRFAVDVPAAVRSAVETQTDLSVLDSWFDAAVTANAPDEFRAAVQQNGSGS